jgi:8-oxo-dGTP pyrophosphatase MutT (NUDIX family)
VEPRTIKLRRPPTLSVMDTPFVPPRQLLEEVERRWAALCRKNPAYFDGRLYHVLGVHRNGHGGASIHVMDCAYRYFAVQDREFDLGVRPLGLKGVTIRDGQVLMGRRAANVAAYAGLWEFAPSGGAEPGKTTAELIQEELMEETGLSSGAEPIPVAVMHDSVLKCWEIVFRLTPGDASPRSRTAEYSELEWRRADNLPEGLSPMARQIAALLPTMMGRG